MDFNGTTNRATGVKVMAQFARRRMAECFAKAVTIIAGALAALQAVSITSVHAADDPLEKFPLVIHCQYKDTSHVFYLSRVGQDGVATYVATDRIAGTVSLDGKAKAIGGVGGGTCVGKTLEELRASGQAHDLRP